MNFSSTAEQSQGAAASIHRKSVKVYNSKVLANWKKAVNTIIFKKIIKKYAPILIELGVELDSDSDDGDDDEEKENEREEKENEAKKVAKDLLLNRSKTTKPSINTPNIKKKPTTQLPDINNNKNKRVQTQFAPNTFTNNNNKSSKSAPKTAQGKPHSTI